MYICRKNKRHPTPTQPTPHPWYCPAPGPPKIGKSMRSNARKSKQQPTVTHRARKVVKCLQRILLIKWSGLHGSLPCCVGLLAVIKSCRPFGCDQIGHDSECRRYRSELFIAICKGQGLTSQCFFFKEEDTA